MITIQNITERALLAFAFLFLNHPSWKCFVLSWYYSDFASLLLFLVDISLNAYWAILRENRKWNSFVVFDLVNTFKGGIWPKKTFFMIGLSLQVSIQFWQLSKVMIRNPSRIIKLKFWWIIFETFHRKDFMRCNVSKIHCKKTVSVKYFTF